MGLETGTYITDLVNTNPVGATDSYYSGDNHARLIKKVLKNSFGAIAGAVTASHTELNLLAGKSAGAWMASGTKKVFYSAVAPTGWTQDTTLNDRILRVVNGSTLTGGAARGNGWTISGFTVGSTILSAEQMPTHTHTISSDGSHRHSTATSQWTSGSGSSTISFNLADYLHGPTSTAGAHDHGGATASQGGGSGHNHGLTIGSSWRPAYVDAMVCEKD